jgi:hypothetical protein
VGTSQQVHVARCEYLSRRCIASVLCQAPFCPPSPFHSICILQGKRPVTVYPRLFPAREHFPFDTEHDVVKLHGQRCHGFGWSRTLPLQKVCCPCSMLPEVAGPCLASPAPGACHILASPRRFSLADVSQPRLRVDRPPPPPHVTSFPIPHSPFPSLHCSSLGAATQEPQHLQMRCRCRCSR